MPNQNKYKIELNRERWNPEKKAIEIIPAPKSTNVGWDALVTLLAKRGVAIAKEIRLHNVGQPNGTRQINRKELFSLWKAVESKRTSN